MLGDIPIYVGEDSVERLCDGDVDPIAYEDLAGRKGYVRTRPLRSKERGTHDCYVTDTMLRTENERRAQKPGERVFRVLVPAGSRRRSRRRSVE